MRRISDKLTITFGLLISIAIFVCGWYLYGQTKHHLDKELGQRLIDIAQTIATHSDGDIINFNVNGGATALGHPLGATGAKLITTMVHELQRRPHVEYGLITMCSGLGQGDAIQLIFSVKNW